MVPVSQRSLTPTALILNMKEDVLPSGVAVSYRGFTAEEQARLAQKPGEAAFNYLLSKCVLSIGNGTEAVDELLIRRLLTGDRTFLLWRIRALSLGHPRTFEFEFNWGLEKGRQHTERVRVDLTDTHYVALPYAWVEPEWREAAEAERERLAETTAEVPTIEAVLAETTFPVKYATYGEMLTAEREFEVALEGGRVALLTFPDGAREAGFAQKEQTLNLVNLLELYAPRTKTGETYTAVHPTKCTPAELNLMYEGIMARNAVVNNDVTIQNAERGTRVVNLFGVVNFFLPSPLRRKL